MTLRKALLARYDSPEAIDYELGEGTYRGIQQVHGGLSSWRKAWSRVRRAQKVRYLTQVKALETLSASVDQCRAVGIPEQDIQCRLQKPLTNASVMPLKAAPNLPIAL